MAKLGLNEEIDDILGTNREEYELEESSNFSSLAGALKSARMVSDLATLKLPEEIALQFSATKQEMETFIAEQGGNQLKREWKLYREALRVKFSKTNKETAAEMQANYQLGIESKSFANINFYFGNDIKEYQALNVILEQTKLQREKNAKEAEAMGQKVMSDEERRELNEFVDGLDLE